MNYAHTRTHTLAGATALANRIQAYWAERGYLVQTWVIEGRYDPAHRSSRYDVRSDLIDGLPRNRPSAVRRAS